DENWGAVSRRPKMVHVTGKVKSREGLLGTYGEEEEGGDDGGGGGGGGDDDNGNAPAGEDDEYMTDDAEGSEEQVGLQRATSINLGKSHVRHISAGSAKLLEISPRS